MPTSSSTDLDRRWPPRLQRFGRHVTDLLLARACPGCAQALPPGAHPAGWCKPCLAAVASPVGRCARCGRDEPGGVCARCRVAPPPYARTLVLGTYAPPLDRMVRALKFGRQPALGASLAAALAPVVVRELAGWPPSSPDPLVVAVPLSDERLAERGYNQSLLIAGPLARACGLRVRARALRRIRPGPPQSRLSPIARALNVEDAFHAAHPITQPVLLVDDVITTGATLAAASRALLAAGAPFVTCIVVARPDSPDVSRRPGPSRDSAQHR